jgi:hypothetical protein
MEVIKALNLGIRFLLELCILIILGYWGFKTGGQTLTKTLLGVGGPVLFAIVWGTFLAPKSSMRLRDPWLLIIEIVIFSLVILALYKASGSALAIPFGTIYILNKILMMIWRQ